MKNLYALSNRIKNLRLQYGYTQKYMAEKLEISYQSYQAYEYGKTIPTLINAVKICKIFDISLDELTGLNEI